MPDETDSLKIKQAAAKKVLDLLAQRDHSETELRQKLRRAFTHGEDREGIEGALEQAIEFAKDNNFIGNPQELAERMADMLHRRHKGILYINNYLREKGLPSVCSDRVQELEKALHIVKNKYSEDYNFSREEKARVGRLLVSRGFDSETVRKVLYEKL